MERHLTYPDDVMNAFEAFITVHGRTLLGGIFYGVPELFFSATLLWTPGYGDLRRRVDRHGKQVKELPSWSWIGWIGDIGMAEAGFASDCTGPTSYSCIHLVDFYKVPITAAPLVDSSGKVLIRNIHFYQDKGSFHDMDHSILPLDEDGLPQRFVARYCPFVETPAHMPISSDSLWSIVIEFRSHRLKAFTTQLLEPGPDQPWLQRTSHWLFAANGTIVGTLSLPVLLDRSPLPVAPLDLVCIGLTESRDVR